MSTSNSSTNQAKMKLTRIKFLASALLRCQQPLKEHEQPPYLTERDRQIKGNNPLQDLFLNVILRLTGLKMSI